MRSLDLARVSVCAYLIIESGFPDHENKYVVSLLVHLNPSRSDLILELAKVSGALIWIRVSDKGDSNGPKA
jgi:hypothetical protein